MSAARPRIDREQAVAYRLRVNHLLDRLPAGSYCEAARVGLQDTAPRDALLGLHARIDGCGPDDWAHPSLIQTYSPRQAVYVLPRRDFGLFTLGRLPDNPEGTRRIERLADDICRTLDGREVRGTAGLPGLRAACASGRIAVRWTTSELWVREVPRPEIDPDAARRELCLRHVHHFAPSSPPTFAWWAGLSPADARRTWRLVADQLLEVDFAGGPGWILRSDEPMITRPPVAEGVRLLVAPDLRLFGQDKAGRFIAPGLRRLSPAADPHHPNAVLVDGRIAGVWGRRGSSVDLVLTEPSSAARRTALEQEVASLPIPDARLRRPLG